MNEELAAETEAVRFTTVRFREGYAMPDVDAFLDDLVQRLRAGHEVAEFVRTARFTPVRLRGGYDMGEVDTFLDRVVAGAAVGTPGPPAAAKPVPAEPAEPPTPAAPAPTGRAPASGLNADLVARLRSAQLPGSGLKEGYAKREVDALLGRLEERLSAGRTFDDLIDAGRSRQRFGYDVAATDELLTSVRYAARYA